MERLTVYFKRGLIMRNLKRTILAAALLLSFSAAGAALGNDVSAASLQAAEPAGPVSNTGRDYRIALINAENTRGPVIHKPLKEEKENPVSRPGETNDANEGSAYREDAPSLRRHDREDSQRLEERRQHRFDKDKGPGRADPAAVTMTGAKEDQPFRSWKMPDSDEAMIHWHRLIA